MNPKPLIYIVDDEEAVLDSLVALLTAHGFSPQAYKSAYEFVTAIDPTIPSCVLVDLNMPGIDGIELLRRMNVLSIRVPVIMMTGFGEVATAVKAMKAGAVDFLEKPLVEAELLNLLARYLANSQVIANLDDVKKQQKACFDKLTEREREVFEGMAVGKTSKRIALDLGISPRTVEIHRRRVMEKLNAGSLSDVVRLAIALNLESQPSFLENKLPERDKA